jgi:hypothetical protein
LPLLPLPLPSDLPEPEQHLQEHPQLPLQQELLQQQRNFKHHKPARPITE